MKRSFKKVIAVLLAALMLMSVMPITASADVIDGLNYGDEYDPDTYGYAYDETTREVLMKVPTAELRAYPYTTSSSKIASWDDLNAAEEITDTTKLKAGDMIQLVTIWKDVTYMSFCQVNYLIDETYGQVGVTNASGTTWTENANTAVLSHGGNFDYGDGFLEGAGAYNVDEDAIMLTVMDINAYTYGMYVGDRELVSGVFAVKVAQDCSLDQIIRESAGNSMIAYDLDGLLCGTTSGDTPAGDLVGPMNWVIPGQSASSAHTHTLSTTPTYNGADVKTHTYTCTAADCDKSEGYTKTEACTFDAGKVTTEATYTTTGVKTYTCSKCSGTYTEDVPKLTCTHDGTKTYAPVGDNKAAETHTVTCDTCKQVISTSEACTFTSKVTTEPTYTTKGVRTYTCSLCNYSYTEDIDAKVCNHDGTKTYTPVGDNKDAETHTVTCDICKQVINTVACSFTDKITKEPDCLATGERTYTCSDCNYSYTAKIPANGHTETTVTGTPATCIDTGLTDGVVCSVCKAVIKAQETIPVDPAKHAGPTVNIDRVEPTMKDAGKTAGTMCQACGVILSGCEEIAPTGVPVTVEYSDMGAVTVNGAPVAEKATDTKNVTYGADYTLTATPVGGVKFVGWSMNGKLVSTDTTYVSTAYMPVTYTPVYEDATDATYTVVFLDKYSNVIGTVATAVGTAFDPATAPEAPAYIGYDFAGWGTDLATITTATTVMAQYNSNTDSTYTVTATGCTITSGADSATDSLPGLAYDAEVTVTAPGAVAWRINGAVVYYGESYTFYVGSDVEVVPETQAVVVAPYVAKVSVTSVTGSHKFEFLATRSMTGAGTLVEAGFVYGKAMTADDLKVENVGTVVNGATVKIAYTKDKSADAQFALSYGITAKNATATAVAFVTYKTASGTVKTIYSELMEGIY